MEMSANNNNNNNNNNNSSTEPGYYSNAIDLGDELGGSHHVTAHSPVAEGQATYDLVGATSGQNHVNTTEENIYQEIREATHYRSLDLRRQVDYIGLSSAGIGKLHSQAEDHS